MGNIVVALAIICIFGSALTGCSAEAAASAAEGRERAVCTVLCGNCRGISHYAHHACTCTVTLFDVESHKCYEEARKKARAHHIAWQLVRATNDLNTHRRPNQMPSTRLANKNSDKSYQSGNTLLKRSPRSASQLPYNPPTFNEPHAMKTARPMYIITIGNSDEEGVELMFPESQGIDIQHEYVYEAADGSQHAFATPGEEWSREPQRPAHASLVTGSASDDVSNSPTVYPSRNYPYESKEAKEYRSVERERERWEAKYSEEDVQSWSEEKPRSWEVLGSQEQQYGEDYTSHQARMYDYATGAGSDWTSPPA